MKRILIIDSLKPIIEKEKNFLSRSDFAIYTASTAEDILKIHSVQKVDLIITSLDTPGVDGDRLCTFIRRVDALKTVSIIIVGPNEESIIERCETCGANAYVTEPINTQKLFHIIGKLLNIAERKRLRLYIRVSVRGKFDDNSFFSTSQNISTSGILLETDKPLVKGDKIICSFFLSSYQITTNGEVMRIATKAEDRYHYGVRFVSPDPISIAQIEEYVKSQHKY